MVAPVAFRPTRAPPSQSARPGQTCAVPFTLCDHCVHWLTASNCRGARSHSLSRAASAVWAGKVHAQEFAGCGRIERKHAGFHAVFRGRSCAAARRPWPQRSRRRPGVSRHSRCWRCVLLPPDCGNWEPDPVAIHTPPGRGVVREDVVGEWNYRETAPGRRKPPDRGRWSSTALNPSWRNPAGGWRTGKVGGRLPDARFIRHS